MPGSLLHKRSSYARGWLAIFYVGGALAVTIVMSVTPPPIDTEARWSRRDAGAAVALAWLVLVAAPMHYLDRRYSQGRGFAHIYFRQAPGHRMDDPPVTGLFTVLSIRAAITTFIFVGLLQAQIHYKLIPADLRLAHNKLDLAGMLRHPPAAFLSAVGIVLGLSLVTTMAALLCSDYSLKFRWVDHSGGRGNDAKVMLRRKAHQFNVIGFYCLMWSLAAVTALLDFRLCFGAVAVVFLVMWAYYFFPDDAKYEEAPAPAPPEQAPPAPPEPLPVAQP